MAEYQEYDAPERFVIDSDRKAEWAINRIKEIAADKQKWLDFYTAKIEAVTDECDYKTANLTEKLREYFLTLDAAKETKTQFSYELPSGKLILKKSKYDFKITDEDKFTAAVAERLPKLMKTKTVAKPDWAEIKKRLELPPFGGSPLFLTEDGEVIPLEGEVIPLEGVEYKAEPEKFEVK